MNRKFITPSPRDFAPNNTVGAAKTPCLRHFIGWRATLVIPLKYPEIN
ncbi:MAG: hypothetical protein ACK5M7_04620 [Draconibacterium sp.]